ncbi:mannan endo-1,4-beta-mannosidase 1-like [Curcuma longa]|uniref:mannan endo-1,4-beta-mannosidase 1-like n=1 Tax=Curcuma longa TaxID=136217 RepID=UPI003D9DE307
MAGYCVLSSYRCYLLVFLAIAGAGLTTPATAFVERKGNQLVADGSVFLFNGFNAYWLMIEAATPPSPEASRVATAFREAAAAGLSVCRTMAFKDGGEGALQVSPGVYDEHVFKALDFVVSEAQKQGFRLIMTLVNNYKELGGRAQYVEWARTAGANVSTDDDFYTNPTIKEYFKNHVQKMLTRVNTYTNIAYKDDPTIMAWELMNEPRCEVDVSGRTVTAWIQEMATYTKSIDNKHLLGTGMEGFYGSSTPDKIQRYNPNANQLGTDFITAHQVDEIDFSSIHVYPDSWLPGLSEENQTEFLRQYLWSHSDDSMKVLQKPLVLGEFGKSRKDADFSEQMRNAFYSAVYDTVYRIANVSYSLGGGLFWQLFPEGMENYDDGFGIVLPQDPSVGAVVKKHSDDMRALAGRREVGNVPYIVENGIGVFSKSSKQTATLVARWFSFDSEKLKKMSENALKLANLMQFLTL